ncbi:MAG TPA: hypothetical protein VMN39_04900 [Longimicrobiaceae bacterium]|nr:hypothetical protein [Longimicrobiaceae bacterium]
MPTFPAEAGVSSRNARSRTLPAILLCAAVSLGAGSCCCFGVGDCPPDCVGCCIEVASVEVVPGLVYTEGGASFELEARARNDAKKVLGPVPAQWSVPDELKDYVTFTPATGNPTVVTIDPFDQLPVGPNGIRFTMEGIRAKIGGKSGEAAIIVGRPPMSIPPSDRPDRVVLRNSPVATPPSITAIDAKFGNECLRDELVAVVGLALFDVNVKGIADCPPDPPPPSSQRAAIFPADAEALLVLSEWSDDPDEALEEDLDQEPLLVPVVLWNGMSEFGTLGDAETASDWILAEAEAANEALRRSRAGFRLEWPAEVKTAPGTVYHLEGCGDPAYLLGLLPGILTGAPELHVVFVDDIVLDNPPESTGDNGRACPPGSPPGGDQAFGVAVLKGLGGTSLIHEVGHVLGLRGGVIDTDGHSNETTPGFDCSNIMWDGAAVVCVRDRFTLGQVFRMNWQEDAWIHHANLRPATSPLSCPPASAACPPLALDIAPPPES